MDNKTLENRQFRANDAKQLLENPLLIEAFTTVENAIHNMALSCEPDNKDKTQRIIISLQLLAGIKRELTKVIDDGIIAKIQLSEIEQKKQFDLMRVFKR